APVVWDCKDTKLFNSHNFFFQKVFQQSIRFHHISKVDLLKLYRLSKSPSALTDILSFSVGQR
ncbi:hypothetical protein, partial [Chryseobacterium camelliae]|uniref:hypothetical protein n=1 Tax=Chryseobacterium camelliae TaxID=1265445 RepID=UPI00286C9479